MVQIYMYFRDMFLFLNFLSLIGQCWDHSWIAFSYVFVWCDYSLMFCHRGDIADIIFGSNLRVFSRCALFLNLFITCWTVKIAFFDPIFICLRTTRRHMKIQLKNDIITVQHVIKSSRIEVPRENTRRFETKMILAMSPLWQNIKE